MERESILHALLSDDQSVSQVKAVEIELEPKQEVGIHLHPIPVVGYIIEGEIHFQIENREPQILKKGDAFHEPKDTKIAHFDNASEQNPARFVAFYLLDETDKDLITML